MEKPCDTCESATTCSCPNCQRGLCIEQELHLDEITCEDVAKWECFEEEEEEIWGG